MDGEVGTELDTYKRCCRSPRKSEKMSDTRKTGTTRLILRERKGEVECMRMLRKSRVGLRSRKLLKELQIPTQYGRIMSVNTGTYTEVCKETHEKRENNNDGVDIQGISVFTRFKCPIGDGTCHISCRNHEIFIKNIPTTISRNPRKVSVHCKLMYCKSFHKHQSLRLDVVMSV